MAAVSRHQAHAFSKPARDAIRLIAGLMKAVLGRDENGEVVRRAGVMAIVVVSGEVGRGDPITIELPRPPHDRHRPV